MFTPVRLTLTLHKCTPHILQVKVKFQVLRWIKGTTRGIKVGEGDEGGGGPRGKDVKGGEDPEMVEEEG